MFSFPELFKPSQLIAAYTIVFTGKLVKNGRWKADNRL